jgi:type II secretory pathway pseudopilin PulG
MSYMSCTSKERGLTLSGRFKAGFTIVEVAVAAGVMVLAISSALIVIQSGFRSLDTARKTTLAAQIIQSEMERIRMLSWSRVEDLMDDPPQVDLTDIFPQNTEIERKVLAEMQRTFTATRSITALADYSNEVVEITVTIIWKGIDGVTHNRSTNTRYCKDGLYNYYYTLAS